jgi:hypothetical protein
MFRALPASLKPAVHPIPLRPHFLQGVHQQVREAKEALPFLPVEIRVYGA